MPETDSNDELIQLLKLQRVRYKQEIQRLQESLAICENAIAEQELNLSGKTIAKGRIISLVKDYILEHGPSRYESLLKYVTSHGGIVMSGDIEKRLRQSLSRCITAETISDSDGTYDLTERERKRLQEEQDQ
jgi:hypothetical protein